ncbi:MAG: DUF2085 domain-containing protein [Methanomassiliicoccus sp.]|nr:DUF2085 domain-containing protein [Methanomassiliicoccus sp.]
MKKGPTYKAKRAVLILFTAWLLAVMVAPLSLPPGTVGGLGGLPGTVDDASSFEGMNLFARAVYLIGDANCHQLPDRSLFINDNQMPFCARDVGIFIGLVLGMLTVLLWSPRFSWIVLAALVLPILIDGGVQYLGGHESNNVLRLITGALGGAGASYFLGHFAERYVGKDTSSIER